MPCRQPTTRPSAPCAWPSSPAALASEREPREGSAAYAATLSSVETCRRRRVNPWSYIADTLARARTDLRSPPGFLSQFEREGGERLRPILMRQDWQHFTGWCEKQGMASLPTTATILALYLTDQACHLISHYATTTTFSRSSHAPTNGARVFDVHNPQLVNVLDGIRRARGRPVLKQATTLTSDEFRQAVENLPNSVQGIRDRALLLLGFAGAPRRSKLCNLDVAFGGTGKGWLKFTPEGIAICIRYSKENQEGVPLEEVAVLVRACRITCPVEAIRVWIELSGISKGALFRVVLKSGRITEQRLSGDAVAERCQSYGERRVGIDPTLVAGQRLRAGFVSSCVVGSMNGS